MAVRDAEDRAPTVCVRNTNFHGIAPNERVGLTSIDAYTTSDRVHTGHAAALGRGPGTALPPERYVAGSRQRLEQQCTVCVTGSSVSGSGNMLTLTLNLRFSSSFAGERIIYLAARDVAEHNSGWQAMGRWTVP
jgi:hypothetical protein